MDTNALREWRAQIRSTLEAVATLMVIGASVTVIWVTVFRPQNNGPGVSPVAYSNLGKGPKQISLDGAELLGEARRAVVSMVAYSDFGCVFCAQFVQETWPSLISEYVDTGKVLIAFKHLPMPNNEQAKRAAASAHCAGRQGKFWPMHDRLFQRQGQLDQPIEPLVKGLGLDVAALEECVHGDGAVKIKGELQKARALGLTGTPTFFFGHLAHDRTVTVTHVLLGNEPFTHFKAILDELLSSHDSRLWSR